MEKSGSSSLVASGPEVELDGARRAEVDAFLSAAETCTHYEALGIAPEATLAEIREAYFRLSKRFHPDTVFGKNLGVYGRRMQQVFQRITDAYDVIGRRKRRVAYDEGLATEGPKARPKPGPVGRKRAVSKGDAAATRRDKMRRHHAKRIALNTGRQMPGRKPDKASDRPTIEGPDDAMKHLGRALKSAAKLTGGRQRREDMYLAEALLAEQGGDVGRAVGLLRLANDLAPERGDIAERYERLRVELSGSMAEVLIKRAEAHEAASEWEGAATAWGRVVEGEPDNANAHRRCALCFARLGGRFRTARHHAQRALELEGDHVQSHLIMAEIFLSAGMSRNARVALEEAAALDASAEEMKAIQELLMRTQG